jgi:putative sterol carrier protein
MPFPFLSPEWIAAARGVRERHAGRVAQIERPVRINLHVTEAPFAGGTVDGHLDTSSGDIVIEAGSLSDADCTVTADYETATALFTQFDQAAAMQMFLAGKIKVQGDMMKLIELQTLIPRDEAAHALAADIKAITEVPG